MLHARCDQALQVARDTIADLRQRLSEAQADVRTLTAQLAAARRPAVTTEKQPVEWPDDALPLDILDEIELNAPNGAVRQQMILWAKGELRRKADREEILHRIRFGDDLGNVLVAEDPDE